MQNAAKRKSLSPVSLAAVRVLLLLVVTLCLGQTRVWGFGITAPPASGVFESVTPSSTGENYDGFGYDASDSPHAAKTTPSLVNLNRQLAAQEIAGGHAFTKHAAEFGFKTQAQMATHIESVMTNPTMMRSLSNGRSAFWDNATGSVVIRNPSAVDGGTAFIPKNGVDYFLNLK
jgi:hypothetical protein